MLSEADILCLIVCFVMSSFFGMLSLLLVFFLHFKQQKKLDESFVKAVAISGNGNSYNDKKPS